MSVRLSPGSFPRWAGFGTFDRSSGFWLAFVANVLWGTTFLASKYTLQAWGPLTASALRFAIALLCMAIFFPLLGMELRMPRGKREILGVTAIAVSGFGLLYPLQLSGLALISSGLSASLMLTSPLFVVGFGALFLKEKVSKLKVVALAVGILGGTILLAPGIEGALGGSMLWGSSLTLLASACLASSVIATRLFSLRLDTANLTFWPMLFGLIFVAPFSIVETLERPFSVPDLSAIGALFYLALVGSALCFLLWNRAISKSPSNEIAATMHIKTPVAVILGASFAGESLTLPMLAGTAVVAFGVWLSQSSSRVSKARSRFSPDLIAEVTAVCNRKCPGCYAPNIFSKHSPESIRSASPGAFVVPSVFRTSLAALSGQWGAKIPKLSLRGGEPSLHPELPQVLADASEFAGEVYLETHGLWILDNSVSSNRILNACATFGTTLKISFDRMHGLEADRLRQILAAVERLGVRCLVAITEQTEAEYLEVRNLLPELADDAFVFQKKASDDSGLFVPSLGVLRVDGTFAGALTMRRSFRSMSSSAAQEKGHIA